MAARAEKIKELSDDAEIEVYHPGTGERYGMTAAKYRADYESVGFEVDRHADGQPILADAKEIESPPDNPALGVQGEAQPVTEGAVTVTDTEPHQEGGSEPNQGQGEV